jgi:hypothetical protein
MATNAHFPPSVVTVEPTETTILELAAKDSIADLMAKGGVAGVHVQNDTSDQTLAVQLWKRAHERLTYAPTGIGEMLEIPPLESRYVELPIRGCSHVKLTGTMSGAGGQATYCVRIA